MTRLRTRIQRHATHARKAAAVFALRHSGQLPPRIEDAHQAIASRRRRTPASSAHTMRTAAITSRKRHAPASRGAALLTAAICLAGCSLASPSDDELNTAHLCGGLFTEEFLTEELALSPREDVVTYTNTPPSGETPGELECTLNDELAHDDYGINRDLEFNLEYSQDAQTVNAWAEKAMYSKDEIIAQETIILYGNGDRLFDSGDRNSSDDQHVREIRLPRWGDYDWYPLTLDGGKGHGWVYRDREKIDGFPADGFPADGVPGYSEYFRYNIVWVYPNGHGIRASFPDPVLLDHTSDDEDPEGNSFPFTDFAETLVDTVPQHNATAGKQWIYEYEN